MKRGNLIAMTLLFWLGVPFALSVPVDEKPITQGEWAVYLARGLGLERSLPEGTASDRYISILSRGGYQRIEGEDYREVSPSLKKVAAPENLLASNRQWLEAGEDSGVALYSFEIPAGRRVTLRSRGSGGPQFWSVNEGSSVMINPGEELTWSEVGSFNLKPGEQRVMVSLPAGGRLDIFEVVSVGASSIEPAGGYKPAADLTYGDKAVTITRGLNLENELPIDGGFYLIREAELYDQSEGNYRIAKDRDQGPASRDEWVKPEGSVRVSYNFEVPKKGLYSIFTRGFGRFDEEWILDLGEEKASTYPSNSREFSWYPVITVFLEAGPHTLEKRFRAGNGFDVFQIVRRRSGAGDYLQLLSDRGFQEGLLPAFPERDRDERRRYDLYKSVEAQAFAAVEGGLEISADQRYGRFSSRGWVSPRNGALTLRYLVKAEEAGTYAIYMRSFGSSPISWKINPAGESSRESREVFPLAHNALLWQEVVTLDLEEGEHIYEVTLREGAGLDVFELRKRAWTSSDLDRLARQGVSREEALRNLKGIEEQVRPTPRPGEPEPTPLPLVPPEPIPDDDSPILPVPTPLSPPPPSPTPELPPLSPYLP
jgi:hypothetical protein